VNALKKGSFVGEYVGEIVTDQELYERNNERAAKKERHTYPVLLDADWGSERILEGEEALCLGNGIWKHWQVYQSQVLP
jgi:SET domain-containing protein